VYKRQAILKSLSAQNAASLVIFMLSGGGSSIAEKPIDDEISLEELVLSLIHILMISAISGLS